MKIAITNQTLTATSRLQLRFLEEKDSDRLYYYRGLPDVYLFQGWTPENPEEVAQHAIKMASHKYFEPDFWYQVVLERSHNESSPDAIKDIIGDVAFCIDTETNQQAELGIALDPAYQKQGYAEEAIVGLVDYLFKQHHLHRIHVNIDPNNFASRQLFERIGFRLEGHLKQSSFFKGKWVDDIIMAILASEWSNRL